MGAPNRICLLRKLQPHLLLFAGRQRTYRSRSRLSEVREAANDLLEKYLS
jgi:hypothetical protein